MYGFYLALLGRVDESHFHYERARQLNPTSREAATDGVYAFIAARQYDQAIAHLRKALLLDPNYGSAHESMAEIYEELGKYLEAIEEWERGEILDGEEPAKVLEKFKPLRQAYAEGGAKGYWLEKRELMDVLGEFADTRNLPGERSYILAKLSARLGEKEQSLAYMETARAEHHHQMIWLKLEPCWDEMRGDPRFQALMKEAGLAK